MEIGLQPLSRKKGGSARNPLAEPLLSDANDSHIEPPHNHAPLIGGAHAETRLDDGRFSVSLKQSAKDKAKKVSVFLSAILAVH